MKKTLFVLFICLFLPAVAYADFSSSPKELSDAMSLKGKGGLSAEEKDNMGIREEALRSEAVRYGLQSGFAWRYGLIVKDCAARDHELDAMYPFDLVLLENGSVAPPIIVRADSSLSLDSPSRMTTTGTAWRIVSPAAFVSLPPSWRNYLTLSDEVLTAQKPHPAILPKTSGEREIWQAGVKEGWGYGVEQAESLFKSSLARLNRDFAGMIQYHVLNRQGMISIPNVSRGHYAVKLGKDTLELDQQVFTIKEGARFQGEEAWVHKDR